jgi:hypothetical protein
MRCCLFRAHACLETWTPYQLIQDATGHIFVATDSNAQQRTVKIGRSCWGEQISILEGINEITSVIVTDHQHLTDGADICIVE